MNLQDDLAQQVIKAMCRKFAGSAKVWLRAYGNAAGRADAEGARKTLDRSISAIHKRKHIKVIILTTHDAACDSALPPSNTVNIAR